MEDTNYSVRMKRHMGKNQLTILVFVLMAFLLAAAIPSVSAAAEGNGSPQASGNASSVVSPGKEVVARVNGVPITEAALQARVSRVLRAMGHGGASAAQEDYRAIVKKALDKLIVQELAYQKARAEGMRVTPKELDDAIAALKKRAGGEKKYKEMLERNNVTEATLRKALERNRLVKRIFEKDVLSKIVISDDEIKKEYEKTKNDFVIPEKVLVDDVVLFLDPANKDDMKKAEAIRAKIIAAKDEDPEHVKSDGTFIVREMELHRNKEKELYDAAVKLKVGEVSDVIRTSDSLHILKLKEYRPVKDAPFDEVKGYVEARLRVKEAKKLMSKWEENLKKGAKIEIYNKKEEAVKGHD